MYFGWLMKNKSIHTRWIFIPFALLIFLASSPLAYSGPAPKTAQKVRPAHTSLRMKDAVLAAIKKHPMSTVGSAHRKIGAAYRSQAKALFAGDPSYNVSYYTDQIDNNRGFREVEGSLDFPIWMKGQKSARHTLGNTIISGADSRQQLLTWEISGEVIERAWALRIAKMEVEQARVQQQSAKKLEVDVNRRVKAGEIARSALILAQQSSAETSMAIQKAMSLENQARAAWKAYTGFSQIPSDLLQQSQRKKPPHSKHPHMIASQARIAAARANRKNVRAQRRDNPTLSIYAKRDRGTDSDPFNNSIGVGVSIPFGTKPSSAPRLAEANATVVDVMAEEAERERKHEQETRQAELTVQAARKALHIARRQNQLAQNRFRLSKRAFELGESDLFLLIRAREQSDIQARAVKRSQLELNLSQARLNYILGAMPL